MLLDLCAMWVYTIWYNNKKATFQVFVYFTQLLHIQFFKQLENLTKKLYNEWGIKR